jgi:NAD-dependent SIR2 family protein deacetylase
MKNIKTLNNLTIKNKKRQQTYLLIIDDLHERAGSSKIIHLHG